MDLLDFNRPPSASGNIFVMCSHLLLAKEDDVATNRESVVSLYADFVYIISSCP
jgi:hypothetical protein